MDGKEVDLPDMKVEGTLAVAELTKKSADEFIPFINTIQEEATLRARVAELTRAILAGKNATDDQVNALKIILRLYRKEPADHKDAILKQANELFVELNDNLIEFQRKVARNSILTSPFFLKRSLNEAYYMLKAYIWDRARVKNEKPSMPFTIEELQTLIDDNELAVFAKYSIERIKRNAEEESATPQPPEEVKKK